VEYPCVPETSYSYSLAEHITTLQKHSVVVQNSNIPRFILQNFNINFFKEQRQTSSVIQVARPLSSSETLILHYNNPSKFSKEKDNSILFIQQSSSGSTNLCRISAEKHYLGGILGSDLAIDEQLKPFSVFNENPSDMIDIHEEHD
jgi:hypothetical protein